MNILITGATGFVGAHLRRSVLANTSWCIIGTSYPDVPPAPIDASREVLQFVDLRDESQVRQLIGSCHPDYIVHLAAQSHIPTAYSDPWATLENNIRGQLNLLEACKELPNPPRTLVVGSSDEYGNVDQNHLPVTEDHPLQPVNPYSVSKVAQDVMGFQYYASFGLPVMRTRPFNHVGPGQSARFVLPTFAKQIAEIEAGKSSNTLLVGNLSAARDFTDVRDVVRAYCAILTSGRPGDVYNIASGIPRTIQSLVDYLVSLSSVSIRVVNDPSRYRPADVPVVYGSAEKLRRDTGWMPDIPFEQTVADVLNEWREITQST